MPFLREHTARMPAPVPQSVSPEAQAFLALLSDQPAVPYPAPDDLAGWQARAEAMEAPLRAQLAAVDPPAEVLGQRLVDIDGVPTYVLVPAGVDEATAPIVVEYHGGALLIGGGDLAWKMAIARARSVAAVTWVPDYRMPPAHRYPAALDDCWAVYQHALTQRSAEQVALTGPSAGGNLAAAVVHRALDTDVPAPAALVLLSPELDLTESGDTFSTVLGHDLLKPLRAVNELYADGADLTHPWLSPLFGNVADFPPTFLSTGTRDLFLSNTVRMHRKLLDAGVPVELRVQEAGPHGGFGGRAPEDAVLLRDVATFLTAHLQDPITP